MKEYIESFIKENKEFKEPFDRLHECILSGTNKVSSYMVSQTLLIDDSWVEQIQTAILSIEKIVKNPRTFIKTEREVLPADRTKKVDGETIRYLARHTSDINEIDQEGNVKPKRLNSGVTEVETGIYENRVVYALILRLENFIRRTVREIENRINTIDSTTLDVDAQYIVDDRKFDCSIVLRMDKESADKIIVDKNQKLLATVKDMSKRLKQIKRTQFCKELATYKKIMPPISKTNLFKMNYDYKNCYECWGLLSANNEIDCRLEVSTAPLPLINQYFNDISYLVLAATLTFVYNANSQEDVIKSMQGKKKKAVRKFKVVRTVNYQPLVPRTPKGDQEELINQFYFDKMVEVLKKEGKEEDKDKEAEGSQIADNQSLSADFNNIFSKVRKINLALFEETMGLAVKEEIKSGSALIRKKALVQREEERVQKYQTILNAMRRDLGWEEKKQSTRLKNLEEEKEKLAVLQAKEDAMKKERAEKLAKAQELKRIEEEKAKEQARIKEEKQKIKEEKEKAKQEAALKAQQEKEAKAKAKEAAEQKAKEEAEIKARESEKKRAEKEAAAQKLALEQEEQKAKAERAARLEKARLEREEKERKDKEAEELRIKQESELRAMQEAEQKIKAAEQLKAQKDEEQKAKAERAARLEKARLEREEKEHKDKEAEELRIKQESELRAMQEAEQKIKAAEQLKAQKEEEHLKKAQEDKLAKEQMKLAESEAKKAAALQAKLEKQEFQRKEKEAKAAALSEEAFELEQIRLNEEELLKEQNRLKQIKREQLNAQKQQQKDLSKQDILENHKRYRQLYYEMTLKIKAAEERKEAIRKLKELREKK